MKERQQIWNRLAGVWKLSDLESMATMSTLEELDPYIDQILQGTLKGRVVVEVGY